MATRGAPTSDNPAFATSLTALRTANVVRELRSTSLGSSLGHVDSAMLDIVALLFDQIFAREEIPPRMKALIGRMQIPILKVAILDNSFLGVKTHPARKLLDCLGELAVSLDGNLDESTPLYGQIQKIVQDLVDSFQDGMDIFDRLREELEGFVAWQNQAAEERGTLLAKRIEYRERLALGKALAQQEILQRAKSGSMPRVVLRFLVEQWVKVMLFAHAKHGDESEAWNKAVATMDLLIWSVRPKHSLAERRTLAGALPRLLRRLNLAIRKLGVEDDERKRFFAELMRCHTNAMNGAPSTPGGEDTKPMAAPLQFCALTLRNPFGEGEVAIDEISLSDLSAGGRGTWEGGRAGAVMNGDGYSRVAATLREGAWVDFRDDHNRKRRARLFYISPLRRTYLFVNVQTGNVAEYSADQLARGFRAGRASVVESSSLFDLAMGGLVGAQRTSAAVH